MINLNYLIPIDEAMKYLNMQSKTDAVNKHATLVATNSVNESSAVNDKLTNNSDVVINQISEKPVLNTEKKTNHSETSWWRRKVNQLLKWLDEPVITL